MPQLRAIAHKIADIIYEKLTGEPGVFSTRIAYVARFPQRFELHVADADGFNSQFILAHKEPIISPAWSPDGTRIAYVSFEQRTLDRVRAQPGGRHPPGAGQLMTASTAPRRGRPDGNALALALSKDGVSQVYLINPDGSGLSACHQQQFDRHRAELLAGRQVAAVHLRPRRQPADLPHAGRRRQCRTHDLRRQLQRHAALQPGRQVVRIHPARRRAATAWRSWILASRQTQILTDGQLDGSPAFAPNGRLILYASIVRGRGILAAVSSDGRIKQKITASAQDVREPAWGPLVNSR